MRLDCRAPQPREQERAKKAKQRGKWNAARWKKHHEQRAKNKKNAVKKKLAEKRKAKAKKEAEAKAKAAKTRKENAADKKYEKWMEKRRVDRMTGKRAGDQ